MASERKQLERQRRAHKLESEAVDEALRALLTVPDGRKFLWWLLTITRYGQQSFTGNALTTAFNCGEQNVGQQLLARMTEVSPQGFINLLKERKAEDERRRTADGDPARGGYDFADPRGDEDGDDE